MKRLIGLFAVLALCLPMVGEGQSIEYRTSGGVRLIKSNPTAVATTQTAAAEKLHDLTVPAGAVVPGGTVFVQAVFSGAANTNVKTYHLRLGNCGGTALISVGSSTTTLAVHQQAWCVRTGATTATCTGQYAASSTAAWASSTQKVTGLNWSADTEISVCGTNAGAIADVTADSSSVSVFN